MINVSPMTRSDFHNNVLCKTQGHIARDMFATATQGLTMMNSVENELFRKCKQRAIREKEIMRKIGLKFRERLEVVKMGGRFC